MDASKQFPVCALVVVYNVSCADSSTCRALSELKDPALSVLIYDNSTADFGNRAFCHEKGWVYLGGSGNVGLSKAYNAGIAYLKREQQVRAVCLFDDDTHLHGDYFTLLRAAMRDTDSKIFVPMIYSKGRLLSPCRIRSGHKTALFATEAEAVACESKKMTAINSCMALELSLFENYRYDENIFLDGIDHNFLMDMKQRGEMIAVFPYRCDHDFSGDSKPSMESALTRFRIYAKDYRYILRGNILGYMFLVGKRALRLTAQYRSAHFLRAFLRWLVAKV